MTTRSHLGEFEGDLEALSVVELVQTLNLGGKTARVRLRSSAGTGALWFRDGAMTHATSGPLLGDLAAFELLRWTSGRFLVSRGLTSERRSISVDTTLLLLEGLRRVDERPPHPPRRNRLRRARAKRGREPGIGLQEE